MTFNKKQSDGLEENTSLVGEIFSGRNLEGFLTTLENLTLLVSDTIREYLSQRERSTQYEQQVLAWFLSLSDVDFEMISSLPLLNSQILGSYKMILQDLRQADINVSNFGKLEGCRTIAIGDSALISGVSLQFLDKGIIHITPNQFQLFTQFWNTYREYDSNFYETKFKVAIYSLYNTDRKQIHNIPDDIQELLTTIDYQIKSPEQFFPNIKIQKSLQDSCFSVVVGFTSPVKISLESMRGIIAKEYNSNFQEGFIIRGNK